MPLARLAPSPAIEHNTHTQHTGNGQSACLDRVMTHAHSRPCSTRHGARDTAQAIHLCHQCWDSVPPVRVVAAPRVPGSAFWPWPAPCRAAPAAAPLPPCAAPPGSPGSPIAHPQHSDMRNHLFLICVHVQAADPHTPSPTLSPPFTAPDMHRVPHLRRWCRC